MKFLESLDHDTFQYSKIPVEILVFGKCAIFGSLRFLIICPFCGRDFEFYSNFPAAARVNSVRRTRLSGAICSFLVNTVSMVGEDFEHVQTSVRRTRLYGAFFEFSV